MTKEDIIALHEGRCTYIKDENEEMVDKLAKAIYGSLIGDFKTLEFEFIIEQLSHLGHCPNLINDDNGHWAISSNGVQNVVTGDKPDDVENHFFIEAEEWKDTPREALWYYLLKE
jgi:hypothetical protein